MPPILNQFQGMNVVLSFPTATATLPVGALSNPRMNGSEVYDVDCVYNPNLSIPWIPWAFACHAFEEPFDVETNTQVVGQMAGPDGRRYVVTATPVTQE